jgi:hypothetical protein
MLRRARTGTRGQSYDHHVDISDFDFGPDELTGLLIALATVTKAIDLEPRLHQEGEEARTADGWVKLHEGLSGSTFRVRCRLRSGDHVLEDFAVAASALHLTSVSDNDGWERIRHDRVRVAAS